MKSPAVANAQAGWSECRPLAIFTRTPQRLHRSSAFFGSGRSRQGASHSGQISQ